MLAYYKLPVGGPRERGGRGGWGPTGRGERGGWGPMGRGGTGACGWVIPPFSLSRTGEKKLE
eukprot:1149849-Pelagomonas_calceolata.AAC.2